MPQSPTRKAIPTQLTLAQFNEFVLPYLKMGSRGPQPKLDLYTIFSYILKLLYLVQLQETFFASGSSKGQSK